MAKEKQVKLGENANSFYDPISGTKVLPGQVVKLEGNSGKSKKIREALRHGHLVIATDEDVEEYEQSGVISNNDPSNDEATDWDDFEVNEKNLGKLKKDKLVELAMHLESSYSQEELNEFKKDELIEEIMEIMEDKE